MKLLFVFILSVLLLPVFSQEGKGYIIKLNNDTVNFKTVKLDRKKRSVNCEGYNGRKSGFKADEVLGVSVDSSFYESGLVRLKPLKTKRFVFLKKIVDGNLNLYEFNVKRTKLSWKTVGKNIITLRWIYRAEDARIKYFTLVYFYRKKNESRKDLSKNWKKKTKDCKILEDKISSSVTPWNPGPKELVLFYNTNCN